MGDADDTSYLDEDIFGENDDSDYDDIYDAESGARKSQTEEEDEIPNEDSDIEEDYGLDAEDTLENNYNVDYDQGDDEDYDGFGDDDEDWDDWGSEELK